MGKNHASQYANFGSLPERESIHKISGSPSRSKKAKGENFTTPTPLLKNEKNIFN